MQIERYRLRQKIRQQRQNLSVAIQQAASSKITELLHKHILFSHSQHIAAYMATQGEINPKNILAHAWHSQKSCYLPVLDEQSLQFVLYKNGDPLILNQFKLFEPVSTPEKIIAAHHLDLVLVPLVAFDLHGNRLGMGKGYYDKTFEFLLTQKKVEKPFLIGLAYDFQKVEQLEKEIWDVPLNAVVTESGFYNF